MNINKLLRLFLLTLLLVLSACNLPSEYDEDESGDRETAPPLANESETSLVPPAPIPEYSAGDKWSLWV